MEKIKTKIGIIGLILMLAIACKSGNSEKNTSEKYTFEYNLPQGETFKQIVSMESKTTQQYLGDKMESVINVNMSSSFKVKDTDADNYLVDMTYDAVRMDMSVMGEYVSFDSDTDEEKAFGLNFNPIFKAMTNIPIELRINKNGRVESVSGYEKILDAMNYAASEIDETTREAMMQGFSSQFSDNAIRETFELTGMYLPPHPVSIGETWNIKAQSTLNVPIEIDMEMKLTEVNDNVVIIKGTGSISSDSKEEINGIKAANIKLKGTQTITIEIDAKTGWVKNADIVQNLKGATEAGGIKISQNSVNIVKITD